MNNDLNEIKQLEPGDESLVREQSTVLGSRRRLLRAGLKAAPVVVATLAARPSLACHCVVPSAWGSINVAMGGIDQDMGQTGLVNKLTGSMARYKNSIYTNFNPYVFTAFTMANGGGWGALRNKIPSSFYPQGIFKGLPSSQWPDRKTKYLQGAYSTEKIPALTVQTLCSAMGCTAPAGCGSRQPLQLIQSGGGLGGMGSGGVNGFGASVLIAQINMYLGLIPSVCVTKSMLNSMATGYYKPEGVTEAWSSGNGQIADFLHFNWIARRQ